MNEHDLAMCVRACEVACDYLGKLYDQMGMHIDTMYMQKALDGRGLSTQRENSILAEYASLDKQMAEFWELIDKLKAEIARIGGV